MWDRRQFLSRGGLALLGTAGTCFALPGDVREEAAEPGEALPDGSASRGMVTQQADKAVELGLGYLRASRHADGSFGTGQYDSHVAITSLAAMAFMAAGNQPNRGPDGKIVYDALRFILAHENVNGGAPGFLNNPHTRGNPHGPMYGHGFATLFLGEVSGMVHEPALRKELNEKLHRAVRLILDSQNVEGGWRYTPYSREADLSVTICQIMALRSARNVGIDVPKSKVDACVKYVKRCQEMPAGSFRYMPAGGQWGGPQPFARTAAGVCALYSAGIYKGPEIEAGLNFLKRNRPIGGFRPDMHYFYGHYYAVQAMWTAGGSYWKDWYPAVRDELISRQDSRNGFWLDQVCTHYATAMACIILQVPNNYLPILQK